MIKGEKSDAGSIYVGTLSALRMILGRVKTPQVGILPAPSLQIFYYVVLFNWRLKERCCSWIIHSFENDKFQSVVKDMFSL